MRGREAAHLDDRIEFKWYSFSNVRVLANEVGDPARVFFGKLLSSEPLEKNDAANDARYSVLFDRNGNFKHGWNVFRSDVSEDLIPRIMKLDYGSDAEFIEGGKSWRLHRQKERNAEAVRDKKEKSP